MKISIIGAGNVGATTALMLAQKNVADIVLFDIVPGIPKGKGLDIAQAAPIARFESRISGTESYEDIADSDIVVITAGLPRKPGMNRMDLLKTNAGIVSAIAQNIARYAPHAMLVVVTNPLDVMAYVVWKFSGFPKQRVVGMAGVLDSSRFRHFIAETLNVSVEDTQALVLGGHGDSMVPLPRYATVSGIPITQLLPHDAIMRLVERTRKGGTEIVNLLKTGGASIPAAAAATQMVEAIIRDTKRMLPASVYLEGEFGVQGLFLGVPIILGRGGVERIIEIELTPEEHKALLESAADVRKGLLEWEKTGQGKTRKTRPRTPV